MLSVVKGFQTIVGDSFLRFRFSVSVCVCVCPCTHVCACVHHSRLVYVRGQRTRITSPFGHHVGQVIRLGSKHL